jgi:hypothetical protein
LQSFHWSLLASSASISCTKWTRQHCRTRTAVYTYSDCCTVADLSLPGYSVLLNALASVLCLLVGYWTCSSTRQALGHLTFNTSPCRTSAFDPSRPQKCSPVDTTLPSLIGSSSSYFGRLVRKRPIFDQSSNFLRLVILHRMHHSTSNCRGFPTSRPCPRFVSSLPHDASDPSAICSLVKLTQIWCVLVLLGRNFI